METSPEISIIIPVFNEEKNLPLLYQKLTEVLKVVPSYEIIMVDDGSSDGSAEVIAQLHQKDPRVKMISFSRNFGHMAALSAGLDYALGQAVITMDADLQHPPELIPDLLAKWKAGAEVVNTLRKQTKNAGIFKNLSSLIFYWVINKMTKIQLPANAADFRLLDRKVVQALKKMHERFCFLRGLKMHERFYFLRGLVSWVGFKQEFVEYEADPRFAGKTKYSLGKMISFALDGITSFSAFPLRLSTYLGLTIAFFSFLYILYALYIKFFTLQAIPGWTSVLVAVLFMGGVQLIFLGILGEYLSRVYEEAKDRPLYIISRTLGFEESK